MKVYVINNQTSRLDHLISLITDTISKPKLVNYSDINTADINSDDIVILSGSNEHTAVWNGDIFKNEIEIIKHHKGPLIGICLGHQLIAHSYGSHVHLLPKKVYGLKTIEPTIETDLLDGIQVASVFESHNWSIQKINDPLIALATSDSGIEVLRHKTRPAFGIQFHPEAQDADSGRLIFERILEEIGLS